MPGRRDDVIVRYGAEDSRFQRVTHGVRRAAKELGDTFGGMAQKISKFFSRSLPGAIAAVGTAFTVAAKGALSFADSLAKTADRIGIGVEDLQRLRITADRAGVSQQQLDTALQRFSRRVAEAAQGTGVLKDEVVNLGIRLRDSEGNMRPLVEILGEYADAVRDAESPQEQLRLTVKAFDTEGAGMVNVLRDGSQAMREQMAAASDLATILDDEAIRASEELNQAWEDLATRWQTKYRSILIDASRWVDRLSGTYRTLGDVQEKIAANDAEIAETQQKLNKLGEDNDGITQSRRNSLERYIGALRRENDELREQERLLEANKRRREEIARTPSGAAVGAAAGGPAAGARRGPRIGRTAEDFRQRTPEEIGAALADFRAGRISAEELGIRAGLQPPDTALRRGAHGTAANQARGVANLSPEQIEALWAQSVELGIEAGLNRILAKEYPIRVRPEVIGLPPGDAVEIAAEEEGERLSLTISGR